MRCQYFISVPRFSSVKRVHLAPDVLAFDWRTPVATGQLGCKAVQGNLDPIVLLRATRNQPAGRLCEVAGMMVHL